MKLKHAFKHLLCYSFLGLLTLTSCKLTQPYNDVDGVYHSVHDYIWINDEVNEDNRSYDENNVNIFPIFRTNIYNSNFLFNPLYGYSNMWWGNGFVNGFYPNQFFPFNFGMANNYSYSNNNRFNSGKTRFITPQFTNRENSISTVREISSSTRRVLATPSRVRENNRSIRNSNRNSRGRSSNSRSSSRVSNSSRNSSSSNSSRISRSSRR